METKPTDLKREIQEERLKRHSEPMWFYDDPGEEWYVFRKETGQVEREYLELRQALRDAELALQSDPGGESLTSRVNYLRTRVEGLEREHRWIATEVPIEMLLWGVPHG
jgi:hypothetical protein